ncbi:uncharacterized protein PAN0_013c4811 [Moesziomyces antarcticus]|uniref:Gag-pol polyprotein n=1 Tax=Pseudozyma antarctica TaxID=84753 RepID=A0A081CIU2_PSEA2|nr:uncharacterized protein PAN0_013c4811 [Moesziomyces antarcticus]GAK66588.1 conserved hypothetical protein [Moesziomyces antarcticus]
MSPNANGNLSSNYPNTRSRSQPDDSTAEETSEVGNQPTTPQISARILNSALATMSAEPTPQSRQRLPRLAQAKDFYRWKEECIDILMQKGAKVYGIVKGTIARPAEDDPLYGEWQNANFAACGLLRSSLAHDIKHTINDLKDARTIWLTLEDRFAKSMRWQLEEMETEFNSLRQEKRSIDGFVGRINELADQLQLAKRDISFHKKYSILIKGLRKEYENISSQIQETYRSRREPRTIMVCRDDGTTQTIVIDSEVIDEKVELDSIITRLRSEELRLGLHSHGLHQRSRNNVSAYYAGPNNRHARQETRARVNKPKQKTPIERITCYNCQEKGHYANKCPKPKKQVNNARSTPNIGEASAYSVNEFHHPREAMWLMDSGASRHICCNRSLFKSIKMGVTMKPIWVANEVPVKIEGLGIVELIVNVGNGNTNRITLHNVAYIPSFGVNLLSTGLMRKKVDIITNHRETIAVTPEGVITCRGVHIGPLTYVDEVGIDFVALASERPTGEVNWHDRLGHPGLERLRDVAKYAERLGIKLPTRDTKCETCEVGKSTKRAFKHAHARSQKPLELVYSDVVGPMPDTTSQGYRYAVTFIDDYSKYSTAYLMSHKSEVLDHLQDFKTTMEKQVGHQMKRLRSDNGGEYINRELEAFLKDEGIIHERTSPYAPEQNGVAERLNRTLFNQVRCMMIQSGAPGNLWGDALLHAVYLNNRLPTKGNGFQTPYLALFGRHAELDMLRTFGCSAFAHVPAERRGKLDNRAVPCVYLGVSPGTKAFKLYDPTEERYLTQIHATFDEKNFPLMEIVENNYESHAQDEWLENAPTRSDTPDPSLGVEVVIPALAPENSEFNRYPYLSDEERALGLATPPGSPPSSPRLLAHAVANNAPTDDTAHDLHDPVGLLNDEPRTVAQAFKRDDWPLWQAAIAKELELHAENNTWTLVDPPANANIIGSRWVFKVKRKADGTVDKYKARLVAQGFAQKHGIDYDETFAPVVKLATLRLLMIISIQLEWKIYQMDVATAYLNGEVDKDLYMRPPPTPDAPRGATTGQG